MSEPHSTYSFETDAIVDHVWTLWRDLSARARKCGVELYAKVSSRTRIERAESSARSPMRQALETGIAIRTLRSLEDGAGFAAASGLSHEVATWVLDRALEREMRVSAESPELLMSIPPSSSDLDPDHALPARGELIGALDRNPMLRWLEAGTTIEVLVGPSGWRMVRRRQRVWAMLNNARTRLLARRGLNRWQDPLERVSARHNLGKAGHNRTLQSLVFLPEAASPIVSALTVAFHTAKAPSNIQGGTGWTLDDDPLRSDGLAGGTFDDAGFPAERLSLAVEGRKVGGIHGPGALRRRSFREPPLPAPSNLTIPSGEPLGDLGDCAVAESTRVIRTHPDLWVLELELSPTVGQSEKNGSRGYVRLSPRELLERCEARLGEQGVTAEGPIIPALRFVELPLVIG